MNEFGKIISLVRGDTLTQSIYLNQGTPLYPIRYTLSGEDKLYLAIMEPNQRFEDAILKKSFNANSEKTGDGDLIITLNSSDTENLLPGLYYYTIKMEFSEENFLSLCANKTLKKFGFMTLNSLSQNSRVWTVVPNRKFFIVE